MPSFFVIAHTTQFSKVGYYYLKHGSGAGILKHGGSYVTLMDADTKDFSIIIETMVCTYIRVLHTVSIVVLLTA